MDFNLTEEHLMIRDAARDFAQNELLPGVIERDTHQQFPAEQVKKMGEMGFMGMMVDAQYGGGGMDTLAYVLVMEELSKVDASSSVIVSVNNSLVCYGIRLMAQKLKKKSISGHWRQDRRLVHFASVSQRQGATQPLKKQPPSIMEITIFSTERKTGSPTEGPQITTS